MNLIKLTEWTGVAGNVAPVDERDHPDYMFIGWAQLDWHMDREVRATTKRPPTVAEASPYQAGDIVPVVTGDDENPYELVRIVHVFTEYLRTRNYRIPKYQVQRVTKKGTWSKRFFYTYPGLIKRGYAIMRGEDDD